MGTPTPNEKQLQCIKTLDGPVMVLAGPGTGKTFTVIRRIKYMLEKKIEPSSILCLTYSEAAANEMKSRLVKEIGTVAAAVCVNTYHSFCNDLIKQYPQDFEFMQNVEIADDITKRNFMEAAIETVNPAFYRTKWGDAFYFIPELLKSVDEIKSNRVTKEKYFNVLTSHPDWQGKTDALNAEYIEREQKGKLVKTFLNSFESHKRKVGKAYETWDIYERYDILMKKNNFIDFNDMINMVVDMFENNTDFLKKAASRFKYFLVDEYQDTNYSQNQIVFKLAEGASSRNIFVVGDDDQIIYEFQGAKTDTLERFLLLFPDTKVICLNENNRSTQNILDFGYQVISRDKTRLEFNKDFQKYEISKILTAKNPDIIPLNKKIQIHGFADLKQEYNFVVNEIDKIIKSDALPLNDDGKKVLSKIAVLTRENYELSTFASLLEARNIKYQLKEAKSIFDIKSSLVLYFYLKALFNPELHADKLFALLLTEPFAFDYADYNYLLKQYRLNHKDFITNILYAPDEHKWSNPKKVKGFIKVFKELEKQKSLLNLKDLILSVANKTGILTAFITDEKTKSNNIAGIKKIIDEASSFMKMYKPALLGSFLKHLDTAYESGIPINIDKEDYTLNAVQLATLHGSKGREFEYVFIPGLIAQKWENKRVNNSRSLPIENEDKTKDEDSARRSEQLRLLFVGITRAKHSLTLSYSNIIDGKPQELTKYLENVIKNKDISETFNHELTKDEYLNETLLSLTVSNESTSGMFKDEVKSRLENFRLSPSSLNAYLNCPRNFLYSQLLKIPVSDTDSDNAKYGNAVHMMLRLCAETAKTTGCYPDLQTMKNIFVEQLAREEFNTEQQREQYLERGLKCVEEYRPCFVQTPPDLIWALEKSFDFVPFEDNFLKGFIDRIEETSPGHFEVYDYKTGSAKPKSKIADGKEYENYLNQLRFYKYAFELQHPDSEVIRAGLLFVEEPDGNFYINLTDEDNKNIKEKIDFVYKNLAEQNFEPPQKEDRKCDFCAYAHFCTLVDLKS